MPEARVIDTNVLVYIVKRDPLGAAYLPHLAGYRGLISFITHGELVRWTVQERWRAGRVAALEAYLAGFAVVHTDDALCRGWGRLVGNQANVGRVPSMADSWIAATALALGAPLVTHNRRHFEAIPGLTVISEAPAAG